MTQELTPGIHAFDQGVDEAGNQMFAVSIVPQGNGEIETFEFAGRPGMTEAEAVAEFDAAFSPRQPTAEEALAIATKGRTVSAKAECRRRIYEVAPQEAQMNMATAAAVISGKAASARTDTEKAILAGTEAALAWVGAMRTAIGDFVSDPARDLHADANWPAIPAAVTAIVSQF